MPVPWPSRVAALASNVAERRRNLGSFSRSDASQRLVDRTDSALAELLFRSYFGVGRRGHKWPNYVNSCIRSSCNCHHGIRYHSCCRAGSGFLTESVSKLDSAGHAGSTPSSASRWADAHAAACLRLQAAKDGVDNAGHRADQWEHGWATTTKMIRSC
jgi:hypothetical protein